MSPQRVLITNDDGIAAPGIRYLARAAADHGFDVVVAAPSEESSGISAAMTAVVSEGRVVIDRRKLAMLDSVPTFAVSASPSYIVTLSRLGAFGDPPEQRWQIWTRSMTRRGTGERRPSSRANSCLR